MGKRKGKAAQLTGDAPGTSELNKHIREMDVEVSHLQISPFVATFHKSYNQWGVSSFLFMLMPSEYGVIRLSLAATGCLDVRYCPRSGLPTARSVPPPFVYWSSALLVQSAAWFPLLPFPSRVSPQKQARCLWLRDFVTPIIQEFEMQSKAKVKRKRKHALYGGAAN